MKSGRKHRLSSLFQAAVCAAGLVACGGGSQSANSHSGGAASGGSPVLIPGAAVGNVTNPILFATQVPTLMGGNDTGTRAATFSNHLGEVGRVARGGDLMIRYPDGSMRNLTREAGYGMGEGLQGTQAIAVREPSVHWSGKKALFSMVIGAPAEQYKTSDYYWQIYEVAGLGRDERVSINKVAGQPPFYNNVSPIYGTDERILFTSDRPRGGESHLYPQLDEYESMPTVTGIWSLHPTTADLRLLTHAVSGAFSPIIDSYGRVIFTRWDHLLRDQQAEQPAVFGAFNFSDESATAQKLSSTEEVFPEPRNGSTSVFGPVAGTTTNNLFTPWQINEDGTEEETLNHIGRHELFVGLQIPKSFTSDPALSDDTNPALYANRKAIRFDGGLFNIREDPTRPGTYYAIYTPEFGTLTSDQIVTFNGGQGVNPESTMIRDFTVAGNAGGRFRNPLPLSDGKFVATHTQTTSDKASDMKDFRIKQLAPDNSGLYVPGASLTGGISKSVSWWDPDAKQTFSGYLWELEPVEVVARSKPTRAAPALEAPERSVFTDEAVDETALRNWLRANDLALIVTRNQTSRDRADVSQPFNLQVPGGVKTVSPTGGKVYDISHFQIFQADQLRGLRIREGRRPIAQVMHDPKVKNPATTGPAGSVKIAADGSTAAFVPARRALAWQSTDAAGNAVVRERVWVTFQPGEVRVCASCHGLNSKDQAGQSEPTNKPAALAELLRFWKGLPK
jgi:Hydrazine synthase alpha subunit middle domain